MSDDRTARPVVGMAGAGPLARLTAQAAIGLGVDFRVFAAASDDSAAQVCRGVVVGSSAQELASFAADCDMLVFEAGGQPEGWPDLVRAQGMAVGHPGEHQFAVQVARSPKGQGAAYPAVRLTEQDGVVMEVIAPAPSLHPELAVDAEWLALKLAVDLDVIGLMTVEFVQASSGVQVTGVTLGPHDAGLWTVEGSRTSQFSQLLQAVLDLPFGTTATSASYTATVKVVGGDDQDLYPRLTHVLAADSGVGVHLYGIPAGPGRRIGHVAVTGDDPDRVRDRAWRAANYLGFASEEPVSG